MDPILTAITPEEDTRVEFRKQHFNQTSVKLSDNVFPLTSIQL